jgi:hypothetical protein
MSIWEGDSGVSYGGYTFNQSSKTRLRLAFVPDASGRATMETVHTLTVKATIAPADEDPETQKTALQAIRAALEQPGGVLTVTGLGFGDILINQAGGKKDLRWGPRPQFLTFIHHGGGISATVEWVCEFSTLGCDSAPDSGAVKEASHELTLSVDASGYTTRTYNGTFTIPMTRATADDGVPPDTADAYFEQFVPAPMPGFARTVSHTLGRGTETCTYTVTDQELAGNPRPEGCTNARASHQLTSEGTFVAMAWNGTLTAEYELQKGMARSDAWKYFLDLWADRVTAEKDRGATPIPTQIALGEPELYGPGSAAFTLNYRLVYSKRAGVDREFPLVGLWRPVPGADWNRWSTSLANGAQAARGFANLRHRAGDDVIASLCMATGQGAGVGMPDDPGIRNGPIDTPWEEVRRRTGISDSPPPETTWFTYSCIPEVEEVSRTFVHFPLPTGPMDTSTLRTPGTPGAFPHTDPPYTLRPQESPAPVVQRGGSPGYFIRLVGYAFRFAYEIPRPQLLSVGGATPVEANHPKLGCYFRAGLVSWTTHPLYAAAWSLRWFVPREQGATSTFIPLAPHPFQQANVPVR